VSVVLDECCSTLPYYHTVHDTDASSVPSVH